MAIPNVLLLSRIGGYLFGLICSLSILVPMSMQLDDFNGRCLLFSKAYWEQKRLRLLCDNGMFCYYVLFVAAVATLVCLVQTLRLLSLWADGRNTSFLSTFLEAVGCTVLGLMVVSAATTVTLGFSTWCQSVTEYLPSCEDLAGEQIEEYAIQSTEWFYVQLDIAQLGAWGLFSTLVSLVVAATLRCLRQHHELNMHAVAPREHTERTPLLNSGFPEDGRTPPADEA